MALLLIGGDRRIEIGGIQTDRPQLPPAEPLGCSQVDVEEVRVTAIVRVSGRKRARRKFWVACDRLKIDTPNDVRCQIPSIAAVGEPEALIERARTNSHRVAQVVGVTSEHVAEAPIVAEVPDQLNGTKRIKETADAVGPAVKFNRDHRPKGRLDSCAKNRPGGGPDQDGSVDKVTRGLRTCVPAFLGRVVSKIDAFRERHPNRKANCVAWTGDGGAKCRRSNANRQQSGGGQRSQLLVHVMFQDVFARPLPKDWGLLYVPPFPWPNASISTLFTSHRSQLRLFLGAPCRVRQRRTGARASASPPLV